MQVSVGCERGSSCFKTVLRRNSDLSAAKPQTSFVLQLLNNAHNGLRYLSKLHREREIETKGLDI